MQIELINMLEGNKQGWNVLPGHGGLQEGGYSGGSGLDGAGVVSYVVGRLVGYSLIVCEADGEKWVSGRPVPLQSVICCDQNKCGIIRGSSATVR